MQKGGMLNSSIAKVLADFDMYPVFWTPLKN